MPKVSVIVPNYNHVQFLEQRIDSIVNQSFQDFELILLDDASTDGSLEILKKFDAHPKVKSLVINSENSGSPFKQWHRGISLATGDYIWIAESDDYCDSIFLEQTVGMLDEGAGIAYTQTLDVDAQGSEIGHRIEYTGEFEPNIWEDDFILSGKDFLRKYMLHKNVIPNSSAVLFRRSLVKESFFSEDLINMRMCGDWYFWIQLSLVTTVAFRKDVHNFFRMHSSTTRRQIDPTRKKQRILEEVVVRNFFYEKVGCSHKVRNRFLIEKWARLHSKWAPFRKGFYELKLMNCSRICLLLNFCRVKLQSL